MFKVICIEDKPIYGKPQDEMKIKEGEVYVVTTEYPTRWGMYYELSMQRGVAYPCEFFIPLSEIDETKMVNSKQVLCEK